eukprot:222539-Pelagomonas_calceolata.AAC.4
MKQRIPSMLKQHEAALVARGASPPNRKHQGAGESKPTSHALKARIRQTQASSSVCTCWCGGCRPQLLDLRAELAVNDPALVGEAFRRDLHTSTGMSTQSKRKPARLRQACPPL